VNIKDERPGEFLSDRLTRDAISFIEANRERPFFVYFPHYAVHTPLAGKPEVIAKYQKKLAAGTYTQTNAIYAALVESIDDSVGAIVRRLEELKLDKDTIIVLTGDNGGLSGTVNAQGWRPGPTRNDPLRLGKGSPYEGGTRVPLIVRWPGVVQPGSASAVPVSSIDYFPTLLEVAGAPAALGPRRRVDRPCAQGRGRPPAQCDLLALPALPSGQRDAVQRHTRR
jgi:arylsulfatase A-like enzyme